MKRVFRILLIGLLIAALVAGILPLGVLAGSQTSERNSVTTENDAAQETSPYAEARLRVYAAEGMDFSFLTGVKNVSDFGEGQYVLRFLSAEAAETADAVLNARPDVRSSEPDPYIAIDDLEDGMSGSTKIAKSVLTKASQTDSGHYSWGVDHIGTDAFAKYAASVSQREVIVAVIDTGVDLTHPFLQGRLVDGYDFIEDDAIPQDENSHGTHLAGTVVDCTKYAENVKIMPVRVFDATGSEKALSENRTSVTEGIKWAVDHGADVLNLSFRGGHSQNENNKMESVIAYAIERDVTVVVTSGNDGRDISYIGGMDFKRMAACPAHIAECITVGAVSESEERWYNSNYGSALDLVAPGVSVNASVPGGEFGKKTGTSMAAPHVAACAALVILANEGITPAEVQETLKANCRDLGEEGRDDYYGCGIVDLSLIVPPEAKGVTLSEDSVLLGKGDTETLTYTVTPGNAFARSVSWSSSAEAVATVSNGVIATHAAGTAEITVTLDGTVSDTCTVVVMKNGGKCGDGLFWTRSSDTELTIFGSGAMWNYSESAPAPWKAFGGEIETVSLTGSVGSVGDNAFSACTNLETVQYNGSAEMWNKLQEQKGNGNECLSAESVTKVYQTNLITVSVNGIPSLMAGPSSKTGKLFVGFYRENGRMITVKLVDAAETTSVETVSGASSIKVFWTQDTAPITAAKLLTNI